jgi:outer membrane lipoprotein-sorting protein
MNVKSTLILCLGLAATCTVQAQKPEALLEKATLACERANGIAAQFAVNIRSENAGVNENFEGTVEMKGDKFVLFTPDIRTWYDGLTQWTYVLRTGEVNITRPSGDDLQFTNPLLLLHSWKKGFKLSYTGESTAAGGKMADDIMLTARGTQEMETVELQLDRATSLPVRITVVMRNSLRSVIRISRMQTARNQTDDTFVFPEKDYPDAEIIDLR